jgi:hypothetical protein
MAAMLTTNFKYNLKARRFKRQGFTNKAEIGWPSPLQLNVE